MNTTELPTKVAPVAIVGTSSGSPVAATWAPFRIARSLDESLVALTLTSWQWQLPPWLRRTNVWRRPTSPTREAKLLTNEIMPMKRASDYVTSHLNLQTWKDQ